MKPLERAMARFSGLLEHEETNALLGWFAIAVLLVLAAEQTASGRPIWGALTALVVAVAVVPPLRSRNPREMIAWEVLAIGGVPVLATYVTTWDEQLSFVAVAALALVIAVELDAFTSVEMTSDFALAFVVLVTMGVAGLWSIGRYAADAFLGTAYLTTNEALMWELVAATAVGLVAGLVFELYVRRVSPGHRIDREQWGGERG